MAEAAPANYIAEFLGTFLLVFTVGCNVAPSGDKLWGVTSIAAVLAASIYALGGVSGANFNPCVSIAIGLSKKDGLPLQEVCKYVAVQIVAGICAGFSFVAVLGSNAKHNVAPAEGFAWWQAGLAETLYTAMLCFVVLCCALTEKNKGNEFFGLAIGFVIVAGGYGAGAISGGCFNPAVALGLDVSSVGVGFGWSLCYIGFEVVGSMLAVGLYYLTYPEEMGSGPIFELSCECASELIGTFFLVLTVGLNVNAGTKGSGAGAWSIAAALMSMIFALGKCSGANFNPAVTAAIWLSGRDKMDATKAGKYVVCQILGGILAAYTYASMGREGRRTFPLGPTKDYGWYEALAGEAVFTLLLCFVVLSVATVKDEDCLKNYFGLAIGFCVVAGGFAIGGVSGGSLNPAVSVGISSARLINGGMFYPCLVYSVAELLGGAAAAGLFRLTHPSEYPDTLKSS